MHPFDLCRRTTPPASIPETYTNLCSSTRKAPPKNSRSKRPQSHQTVNIFDAVNRTALPMMESLCARWLPNGKRWGNEWVTLNPTRADTRAGSFKVNVRTGHWADFATDARGGDAISLRAYLDGMSQIDAARLLIDELGVDA